MDALILQALNEGLEAVNEKTVLELYRNRKITLQKAAEMLYTDIWDMIDEGKEGRYTYRLFKRGTC